MADKSTVTDCIPGPVSTTSAVIFVSSSPACLSLTFSLRMAFVSIPRGVENAEIIFNSECRMSTEVLVANNLHLPA